MSGNRLSSLTAGARCSICLTQCTRYLQAARLVAEGADEQVAKQRQVRQPLPGLAVPDILRHPFFGQHMLAGRQQDGLEDLLAGRRQLLTGSMPKAGAWQALQWVL